MCSGNHFKLRGKSRTVPFCGRRRPEVGVIFSEIPLQKVFACVQSMRICVANRTPTGVCSCLFGARPMMAVMHGTVG